LKANDGAFASMDKTKIELTEALIGGHDYEELCYKEIIEMEKQRLQSQELRHHDIM